MAALGLVPSQTAPLPHVLGRLVGRGFGPAAVGVPALLALLGITFVVRQRFVVGRRTAGLLVLYTTALLALQLAPPSGPGDRGAVGAFLAAALRRSLGDPGLWAAVVGGAAWGSFLLSGLSLEDLLHGLPRGLRALAAAAGGVVRRLAPAVLGGVGAGLRWSGGALLAAARAAGVQGGAVAQASLRAIASLRAGMRRPRPVPALVRPETAPEGRGAPLGAEISSPTGDDQEEARAEDQPGAPLASGPERSGPDAVPEESAEARPAAREEVRRRRRARVQQEALPFPRAPERAYALPDLSLLDNPSARAKSGKADPEEVARSLERTLASFGVEARVVRWEVGPVVTRYELQPAPGVKVQKITSLQNDIALALAASSVRLEAPIPGKSAIGVELPNDRPSLVHLREILSSEEFQRSPSPLTVAIGKGIAGTPVVADLVAMPHLLIAGATGSGKSVALNSMIASILFRSTPEQARFLMIDPKRVELTNYNGIPHLLSPVVTGPREAAAKLRWAIQEMESRYELFAAEGVRNIQAFNAQHPDRPLAYIVIIIDELADLMMIAPADFEEIICRLAQMTRATGIHLVVATQRPSVDVITGLIKANIPSRIAFAVTSQVDSRTILDHPGAEKLLGRGDMLFSPIGATRPTRVQGAYISDAETERLVQFWRAQGEPAFVEALVRAGSEEVEEEAEGADALLADAARLVVRAGYASVSLLQRKMRIGYVRAARLVDQLEERGIVGPAQGSNPREVLVGVDDVERLLRNSPARAGREA